jgi:predicted KAP-like P-loop ATPase
LFPNPEFEVLQEQERQLRVCTSDYFDRYFKFSIPQGDLPQTELEALLSSMGNRKQLAAILLDLNRRFLVRIALTRLVNYENRFKPENAETVIGALFHVGDELAENLDDPKRPYELQYAADGLIRAHLEQLQDSAERFRILKNAVTTSDGIYLPVVATYQEGFRVLRKKKGDANYQNQELLNEIDIKRLQELCVRKIRVAANKGGLQKHPKLKELLERWKEWGRSKAVIKFTNRMIETEPLNLLEKMLGPSVSGETIDIAMRQLAENGLTYIQELVNLKKLHNKLAPLKQEAFTPRQKLLRECYDRLYKERERELGMRAALASQSSSKNDNVKPDEHSTP